MELPSAELTALRRRHYDFLDFGASKAASIEYGKNHFGAKRGLGIDLDEQRVKLMKRAGYDGVVGDLTKLELPPDCVRFVKMAHILEHLPSLKDVEKVISTAENAATDFLVITGPYFDADEYLKRQGLKFHWSDYPDHPCHLKVSELTKILEKHKLDFELFLRYPIRDSSNTHILPMTTPSAELEYNPKKHPKKPKKTFDRYVWVDFVCYVPLKNLSNWQEITQGYSHQVPYLASIKGARYLTPQFQIEKSIHVQKNIQALEDKIHSQRAELDMVRARLNQFRTELANITSSKTWKLVRIPSKVFHPGRTIKKIRERLH